jgi:hypothetical protein
VAFVFAFAFLVVIPEGDLLLPLLLQLRLPFPSPLIVVNPQADLLLPFATPDRASKQGETTRSSLSIP